MAKRRGPFKLKVPLPVDEDTNSDSKPEVKRADVNDSESGFNESSSSDSEAEVKLEKRKSCSSSSSSEEDSDIEEKPRDLKAKDVEISSSSSSDEDSSASDLGSSEESEDNDETPPIKQSPSKMKKHIGTKKNEMPKEKDELATTKKIGAKGLKRLKRMSMSGSSDDESETEEAQTLDSIDTVKMEADGEDTEEEMDTMKEEAPGSDTDDEDWKPQDEDAKESSTSTRKWDEIVEDSDEEWRKDEWEDEDIPTEDANDEEVCGSDVAQAKFVLRNITSRIPLVEETAIRRGVKLSGPPLEFATSHLDEYARKFRWPQHFRNLRNTDFSQDPSEILEDYEVFTDIRQPDPDPSEHNVPKESPFAQVPRPIIALAAEALQRSSRKRKRTAHSENRENISSASRLFNTARVGGQFGDHFVESLLTANGKALQGIADHDYDERCWSSLPIKKKPVANWRFVLEHVRRTMGRSESDGAVFPPMRQETLERITKRLKDLYGYTTQHEESDVFAAPTPIGTGETSEESKENNE
ncbi:hypothetical protein GN958_ATG12950 [Phytophthora infestans]|nr:hypothetical protein GN958_ATG12950 [Phytophthora infestans]